ncbi:major facilitator superfamily transporter multidrug resistance [Niveomyces insectorum RCEF 264]|uniref:Major facilitator superfamily transporter multidrug resistance n=1 Tax=Niveomyces insectorum RCEF 264 TaxID=1081102 RepID=A0A167RAZ9_9HYPO|nr:major facilitator superfamily transporter multidrug resistance [Niveomyces insectorum RCEF 264]
MSLDANGKTHDDLPLRQLAILLTCRLVEPLAVNSIVPYLFSMVKHASPPRMTDGEVTQLVTLIFSAYSLAQFGTNIVWGRISDRVGRRPVMLFGLTGVLISTLGFAFSTSVASMFVFRIAAGLLSGNVVITRTMIGDMVHGRENKARAFAWNQTAYQVGIVVGPFIGGYLVEPCVQVPGLCRGGRFALLQAYPFALPNLVIAGLLVVSLCVAYFHLAESLIPATKFHTSSDDETSPLIAHNHHESLPSLDASASSQTSGSAVFSSKVVHVVLSYAFMALHSICFDQIFPVFLATSRVRDEDHTGSPFSHALLHPKGGLGYSSTTVASFMSASGLLSIVLMVSIFPPVDTFFGSLHCLRGSQMVYPAVYVLLPYLVLLPASPTWVRLTGVALICVLKTAAAVFSFNDNAILLNVAAPSPQALGLVNGLAQMAANGARALGPAVMGLFIRLGDHTGSNALGWWFLAVVGALGAFQGFWVTDDEE